MTGTQTTEREQTARDLIKDCAPVGDVYTRRPLTERVERAHDTRFLGLEQECGIHLT